MSARTVALRDPSADVRRLRAMPAAQQPVWPDREALRQALAALPSDGLVPRHEVTTLHDELRTVDASGGLVLQLGDCVEDIATDVARDVRGKLAFVEAMGDHLATLTSRPVVTVGRLAGQYAKPRSSDHEDVGGFLLPSYRGPIVNDPAPDAGARRPDPANVVRAHEAARIAHRVVSGWNARRGRRTVWTSHELLLLDYELRFLEPDAGRHHLSTTHWPWIGARTQQPDGAHLAVASTLSNPVSVKIGPATTPQEAVDLSHRLHADGATGPVTFIARLGRDRGDHLQDLARSVARRGAPVRWICDPMHGNTFTTTTGVKSRRVEDVVAELRTFQGALLAERVRPAGLHLESTPQDVHECCEGDEHPRPGARYRTLLDPRLDLDQTRRVLDAWFV